MSEISTELSPTEHQLVKSTTDALHFQDRRKQGELSRTEEIEEIKLLLQHFSETNNPAPEAALADQITGQSSEIRTVPPSENRWEQLVTSPENLDYETFIGELVHQQTQLLREQGHNFGDEGVAKKLLFPTVLRFTSEYLSQQKRMHELERAVFNDELTKILNQNYFKERFPTVLESEIKNGRDAALLFIDTDNFKEINDSHGHPYGDAVLKNVALILGAEVRDLDVVMRMGGDELAILLKNVAPEKAVEIAERIRSAAESKQLPLSSDGKDTPRLTFSIGVATTQTAKTTEEFKHQADIAMYQSKRTEDGKARKNCVTAYTPGMQMPAGGENGR